MPFRPVERVLALLEGVRRTDSGWTARCPAHDDRRASLSVAEGDVGRALVKCHAGCGVEAILAALKLTKRDLFERTDGAKGLKGVATYRYRDEKGQLLFEVVRFEPKGFRQRRPGGNDRWIWNLKGVRKVLYRLPEVLAAVKSGRAIYVVEGEKDVEAIIGANGVATCNPGGAGKWRPEYSKVLKGAKVIVVADKDEPGRKHAHQITQSLGGIAATVEVVQAKEGRDPADHLGHGLGLEEFVPIELDSLEGEDRQNPATPATRYLRAQASGDSAGFAGSDQVKIPLPDLVDAILSTPSIPARIKRREAAKIIIGDLTERGELIQASGGRQFWLDKEVKRLYDLDGFRFRALFIEIYQVNPAEPEFRHIMEAVRAETRSRGKQAAIYRFAYYNRQANRLFISAGRGRVVRLDGREATWQENGTDGVLFEETEGVEPIPDEALSLTVMGDPIGNLILGRVNFVRGAGVILGHEQQHLILRVWILAVFFPELLPSKVLLLLYGEKGSGKTTTLRLILKLLLGASANVTPLAKEDGFNATVSQEFLVALDNVDSHCRWIEDRLATVATGQTIRLRKLYTTNQVLSFPTRCFIALTARTPRFRRDDVVDRLQILRVSRLEKFRREAEWYAEIEEYRAALWAHLLRDLNRVLAQLERTRGSAPETIRMADWGFLATTIGEALGEGDAIRDAMEAAELDKAYFLLEADELYDLIHALAADRPNHRWKAGELFAELKRRAEDAGVEFSIKSPKSLGRILHRLEPALKRMINFQIIPDSHDGQAIYVMGPPAAPQGPQGEAKVTAEGPEVRLRDFDF